MLEFSFTYFVYEKFCDWKKNAQHAKYNAIDDTIQCECHCNWHSWSLRKYTENWSLSSVVTDSLCSTQK